MSLAEHFFNKKATQRRDLSANLIRQLYDAKAADAKKAADIRDGGLTPTPDELYALNLAKATSLRKYTQGTTPVEQLIVNTWQKAVEVRRQYLMNSDRLRLSYIADSILDMVTQDVLNANDRGEIIEFNSNRPEIKRELENLQKKFDFDALLSEMTRDFIDFGEFSLSTTYEEGKGLVAISDNVDQLNVLAFYDSGTPINFLVLKNNDIYEVAAANQYAHFVIGHNKLRILMKDQLEGGFGYVGMTRQLQMPDEVREKLPDYMRIGKPFFFATLEKLEQLEIMERLIPAMKLNEMVSPSLVSIKMPAMDPLKAMAACAQIEALLNVPIGVDVVESTISIADLVSQSAHWRAIPDFSGPDTGRMEPMNARQSIPVDDVLKSINDYRSTLLSSMGLPPSLMFAGCATNDSDAEKSKELRIYGRYARRLASIQRSLIKGLTQIAFGHLVNKGFKDITRNDVEIVFKHKLVDLSGLESLELDDAKQAIVSNSIDFVNKICNSKLLANGLKQKVLMELVQKKFNILTDGTDMFDLNAPELDVDQLSAVPGGSSDDSSSDDKETDDAFIDLDDTTDSIDKSSDNQKID